MKAVPVIANHSNIQKRGVYMGRSLDELIRTKKELGSIGALDFLISLEQQKFSGPTTLNNTIKLMNTTSNDSDAQAPTVLVKALSDSVELNKKLTAEITIMTKEKNHLQEQCRAQEQVIQERFKELAILSRMLMNQSNPAE